MPLYNHLRRFRPLRGGIYVFNPQAAEPGTIGCIATTDGADRWIVSCYHVLCRSDFSAFNAGEPIYQPSADPANRIGEVQRGDAKLDCAAAQLDPEIQALPEVFGVPRLAAPVQPIAGMRVVKSGMATGVTEGVITAVDGAGNVDVSADPAYPADFEVAAGGDSGSVWVHRDSLAPVALHRGAQPLAANFSAISLPKVFLILGLVSL